MVTVAEVAEIYNEKLFSLVGRANAIHRRNFPKDQVQLSSLLSIKTGGCPENCAYCPQSAHYQTGLKKEKLMAREKVVESAQRAQKQGATRFCMGAAWREVKDGPDFDHVLALVREVRALGLEVCCTLGMVNETQARRLKDAGLYAYNHNIDTSRQHYSRIISTRGYDDRLRTIENVRNAGITVCTGGIIGMGESDQDRIDFLWQLASFDPQPESVTVNSLVPIAGTPLGQQPSVTPLDLVRVIAAARILLPQSMIRLSAGRRGLSEESQFLCYLAGANSIFLGEKLLTSPNPSVADDESLLSKVGLNSEARCST